MEKFPLLPTTIRHVLPSLDPEVKAACIGLLFVSLDWLTDIGTGIYHAVNGNTEQSLFTFGIVVGSGFLITLFYLIDRRLIF